MKKILITGGMGYIGSHVAIELINAGYDVYLLDNLYNSEIEVLDRIELITKKRPEFVEVDLLDQEKVNDFFSKHPDLDAVINFAALKAAGESVAKPLEYYTNNLDSLKNILINMKKHNIHHLIFPSSACVYGDTKDLPVTEETGVQEPANPYGSTKMFAEQIIKDATLAHPNLKAVIFRFFNVAGAHESGLIGELPKGVPNNLVPFITQTAAGIRNNLNIFGNDFKTSDGYGVRDYVHVVDIARAHLSALDRLFNKKIKNNFEIYNLSTNKGTSVMEVVKTFEQVNNIKLIYKIVDRRPGDIDESYADSSRAENMLGWKAERNIEDIMRSAWQWEKRYRGIR